MNIQDSVLRVIKIQMGISTFGVTPEMTLKALGVDSLDLVEMVMALEEEFEIEMSDDVIPVWHDVNDIVNYVTLLINEKNR